MKINLDLTRNSSIVRRIQEVAGPRVKVYAETLGDNGDRLAVQAAKSLYNTNRPTDRRRSPGSERLGSGAMFKHDVVSYSDGSAKVAFRIDADGPALTKFKALNSGSGAHEIPPRVKKALYWPGIRGGRPVKGPANHPGTTGSQFWQKAIKQARRNTRI